MSTVAAAFLPNTTPWSAVALAAVMESVTSERPACTPIPISVMSTTIAASDAVTQVVRERADACLSATAASYLRRPASVRIRLADGRSTWSCRPMYSSIDQRVIGQTTRYTARTSSPTSRRTSQV